MTSKTFNLVTYFTDIVIDSTTRKILAVLFFYAVVFLSYPSPLVITITGALSALIEAVIPIPQLYNNYMHKSVESLRLAN